MSADDPRDDGASRSRFERFTHGRRTPAHPVPIAADHRPIIIFVTVCANARKAILAHPDTVELIVRSWAAADHWLVGRYIILPDHRHLFCAPGRPDHLPVQRWIAFWKSQASQRWPRPNEQPIWQTDSWDTQLRRGENYAAKWEYVRNNAVRHDFVSKPEDWPHQGELNVLAWH